MARFASLLAAGVAAAVTLSVSPAYAAAPPTPVTGLAPAPASGQVTLTWTNPADADFGGVLVRWAPDAAPATTAEGTEAYAGTGTTVTVTGLTNGTTYGFSVFTRNTADEFSAPVSVTAVPVPPVVTAMTAASTTPVTVAYGAKTVLKAVLKRSDTGAAVSGALVEVHRRRATDDAYSLVYRVRTNASGVAAYTTGSLLLNARWYLKYAGSPQLATSKAPLQTLVAPKIAIGMATNTVEQNVAATVRALVSPSHAGRRVALQHYYDGAWHHVAYHTLTSSSRTSYAIKWSTIGTRYYRIVLGAHADHTTAKTTVFGVKTIARTLRAGMSGADVTEAQKRLAALKYDVGTISGAFGYDTVHATMAFQKVNGLKVNGTIDAATRSKMKAPVRPRLRYSRSGAWVEADLTKQVLYYVSGGVVARILDISSGNNQLFTVDGETQRATTPTGSFRVFHRIDGKRESRLGTLWRPAYFASGGYAIHGSGFVPAYPDSHGCIRITNPAMDRLFAKLVIGLPVFVYKS
jgi:N-acetylmuramoyl-L-alanine amidase